MNGILTDFAQWYADALEANEVPALAPPAVDLATLLGHFVALRQEINLQTRSVRAQQEQTAEFARDVRQGIEAIAEPAPISEDNSGPLLKSLIEVYDALALAGAKIQLARAALLPALAEAPEESPAPKEKGPRRTFWQRWFLSPAAEEALKSDEQRLAAQRELDESARKNSDRVAAALDGLVAGYTMSLERIERALRQYGLEPIEAVGQPFDPERMEALEAVASSGRPNGEVVEEVRRGYTQGGRLYRCAVVRVAKG